MLHRQIPNTPESLPIIGLGTWQTFDVGPAEGDREPLVDVLRRFTAEGGRVIDSSPMYGRAEEVVGDLRENVPDAFLATKVWTHGRDSGIAQMERSMSLMKTRRIDLMQIHNLVDWRTHLRTLRRWREEGKVRYIGITHYHTGAFPELETILRREEIDFVQLPYSAGLPDAETALLPLAADRGTGVLVNRPFQEGAIFRSVRRQALPSWAAELDCQSWGELFLRWVVSHPAVTCVIPATRNPEHLSENMRAGKARLLTPEERGRVRRVLDGI